ncbi:MAG: GtrA family protein [Thermoguttaceae bacterium]
MDELLDFLRALKHRADTRWGVLSRFMQFCLIGASGMAVDLSSLWVLRNLALGFAFSRAIAIWIAMTYNYALNRRFTFNYSRHQRIFFQYLRFIAACAVGAVISWSIAVGLVGFSVFFGGHEYLASIIGIVAGTVSNFIISLFWVFQQNEELPAARNE